MSLPQLNWAAAEVNDGTLRVELDGELSDQWKQSFEATVRLLRGGEWGEIQIEESTVEVSDVGPGSEDKLRHHLESVVDQANADSTAAEREDASEEESEQDSAERGPDAEMTERFRSFGEADEEAGEDERE